MDFIPVNRYVLLIMSHILGDIIFTSNRLAALKRNAEFFSQILGLLFHSGIHAVFAGLLLFMGGGLWLRAALLVFAVHFFIDFIRCRFEINVYGPSGLHVKRYELFLWVIGLKKCPEGISLGKLWPLFIISFLDQGIHLGSLYGISLLI